MLSFQVYLAALEEALEALEGERVNRKLRFKIIIH